MFYWSVTNKSLGREPLIYATEWNNKWSAEVGESMDVARKPEKSKTFVPKHHEGCGHFLGAGLHVPHFETPYIRYFIKDDFCKISGPRKQWKFLKEWDMGRPFTVKIFLSEFVPLID